MIVHAAPWVVPVAGPPIRDGAVALEEDHVVAVGTRADLGAACDDIEEHDGVLAPGFVNAHLHLELSHLRVAGGDGLVPWIRRLLAQRAGADAPAARAAAQAMAARGTVAAVDISNDAATSAWLAAAGIRARVLHERLGPNSPPAPTGNEETAHATYTCGERTLRVIAERNGGFLPSIHVEEDAAEAAWLVDGDGPFADFLRERDALPKTGAPKKRPIEWLDTLGVIGDGTLLVHLTCAGEDSLALAAARGCIAVLCPRSNLHIGGRLPPVAAIARAGLRVALGTDSLASCPTLDVLGDVQTLARAGADPAWLLAAATLGGAAAVGDDQLGALAPGKRPGLVLVGDDARGFEDPVAWLVHEGADAPIARLA